MAEPARRPNRPPVKFKQGCMIFGNTTLGHTTVKIKSRRRGELPEEEPEPQDPQDPQVETGPSQEVERPLEIGHPEVQARAQKLAEILGTGGALAPPGFGSGRVVRLEAAKAFVARHRRLAELRGLDAAKPRVVFHWTQEKNFEGISQEGLRVPDGAGVAVAHGSSFGVGIYVSPDFRYGKELFAYGAPAGFMCLALPGCQHFGKPTVPFAGGAAGFDSVIGREGQRGVDEWVFFRSDQLLPCFLLDELGLVLAKDAAHQAMKAKTLRVQFVRWVSKTFPANSPWTAVHFDFGR
ncbi:unnamed protein product [Effrenium voratum]|nr:unnamed protein product [Effrenium voratum]